MLFPSFFYPPISPFWNDNICCVPLSAESNFLLSIYRVSEVRVCLSIRGNFGLRLFTSSLHVKTLLTLEMDI